MTIEKRLFLCRMTEKMDRQKDYSKTLGLMDNSKIKTMEQVVDKEIDEKREEG